MRYPIFAEQRALVEACETQEEVITIQNYLDELERRLGNHFDFIDYLGKGNNPSQKAIDQEVANMDIIMNLMDTLRHVIDEKLG